MRFSIGLCGLILYLCLGHNSYNTCAQSSVFSFDHLTVEEGLSQSTVLAITQDAEGFLWFGTRDGLNRYDARKVTVYRHDSLLHTSISDNTIYSLLTDSRGRLWAGTRKGLNLYDPVTDSFHKYFSDWNQATTVSNNTITCILEDRHKNIWVGTRYGLNLLVEKDSLSFTRFRHDENNNNSLINNEIRSIFQDKEGAIWISTPQGISKLRYRGSNDFTFDSYQLPRSVDQNAPNNWVNAFTEDKSGRLVVGTERNGLIFFNKNSSTFSQVWPDNTGLKEKAIRTMLKDNNGNFWIGAMGGLFIVNEDFSKIQAVKNVHDDPASITDNSIRSIFLDRDGSYWIGTYHGGVNTHTPLGQQFKNLKLESDGKKFHFKVASSLITDAENNLWVGTEGDGLLFLDRQSNRTTLFKHDENNSASLSHDNIKCILPEGSKGIWIGTIKGLDFYDFKKKTFIHFNHGITRGRSLPDDSVYDLVKDQDGKLWVATYKGGLLKFDPAKGIVEESFTRNATDEKTISSPGTTRLLIDSRKNLWIGTISGLNKKTTDGFIRFFDNPSDPSPLSGGYILCLYEDSKGQLWIGTRANGLKVISENDVLIKHFSTDDGLPANTIYGIQEDNNGNIWLSTEHGLSRLDTKSYTFKNFDRRDGLVCKQFNFSSYHKDKSGYLYFGGYDGVVYFHPDSISENRVTPPIAFTGFKLFNKEVRVTDDQGLLHNHINYQDQVEFRHDQNIFSVEFSVLNYINAEKNQFAYKLEGFEKEWNIVKEPVATYMNLQPGKYTLLIKGSNNDGYWNTPKAVRITILPAPWKTWWAYAGYLAIFLSMLYLWSRLNKKRVKLEHDLRLEHLEKVKQQELHQAKLNFFTNIAHEIRTPVTLIAGPLGHLLDNNKHDAALRKELTLVKNNTDRLNRLLNQLLDFQKQETGNMKLKVSNGNIVEFIGEILYSFREYADSRKVLLNFKPESENILLWFDGDELSKVFYNLLVNALKFTPGGGEVKISVMPVAGEGKEEMGKENGVKIIIEDNGLGISSSHLKKIFHRFYQAENTGIQEAGFGIGLALTKGIIDLHHGTIFAESREATGEASGYTRFTILIPGGNAHFDKDEILLSPLYQTDNGHHEDNFITNVQHKYEGGEKPLILLVEDNDEIRMYVRDMLRSHYDVIEARNGVDGWEIAVEQLPDIIVSDVMMPQMNGLELVSKLKTDQRTSHIPVILLTARRTLNHQIEGLETGADDYLSKPFNTNLLLVKIKNHLTIREKLKEKYSRMVTLEPKHEELENPEDKFLQRLTTILEENITDSEFNVSKLVKEIGMSRPVLFRKTKMLTGLSVIDLIRDVRMKKAEMLLRQKKLSISEIAFTVGFSDPKYFSKSFRSQFGKPPSQYLEELE